MSNIKFNVAQLLREAIGAKRVYEFTEPSLCLDDERTLRDITGSIQVTRTMSGVFAHMAISGTVTLVCVRSLELFDQHVVLTIQEEFHSIVDVNTGMTLNAPIEEEPFLLDANHMLDAGEAIREYALIELPLYPVCDAYKDHYMQCSVASDGFEHEECEDTRLNVLKQWQSHQKTE